MGADTHTDGHSAHLVSFADASAKYPSPCLTARCGATAMQYDAPVITLHLAHIAKASVKYSSPCLTARFRATAKQSDTPVITLHLARLADDPVKYPSPFGHRNCYANC